MSNINFTYTNLTPFKWYVLENFPFIEADFDALTNWQLFCKLGKEMNKIINSVNVSGDQVETLTTAFNNLQNYVNNYFDNLDVQDEINNKLDELVNNGTLSNLLEPFFSNINKSILDLENNKRNKSSLITMNDLSQDVKEALTGGSTAVVGKQSVNNATIQDFAISPNNLNFVNIQDANLLNINLVNDYYYDAKGSKVTGNYCSSDFIETGDYTINKTTWYSNMTKGQYVLFDQNKDFIKIVSTTSQLKIDVENVKYIKMNILKSLSNFNDLYLLKDNNKLYINNILKKPDHQFNNFILVPTENIIGNTISPDNTNFIEHITNNLFNKFLADKNGTFDNNGNYKSNTNTQYNNYGSYIMSMPVYIKDETIIKQKPIPGFINCFDNNWNWLGNISNSSASSFTIPYDNVAFITKSLLISNFDNYYLIVGNEDLTDYYKLKDFIQLNLPDNSILSNKKIGFLGDSITYGLGVTTPYPSVIQNNTNCNSINYGISGNSIAKAGPNGQPNAQENPMCIRYAQMDNDLDYILVFGGTNDYAYQIPLGEETSNDIETFYGGLNTLIEGLIEKYPGKPLLFLTPLYRTLSYESGYKFLDYVEAIKNRCKYYSIPYFNLTDRSTIKSLIDTINNMYYVNGDRLHPNEEGQKIIARIIQHQLEII